MEAHPHAEEPDPELSMGAHARVVELQRRIEELEAQDDEHFGRFGRRDWLVCVCFALLVPALVLIWFAR